MFKYLLVIFAVIVPLLGESAEEKTLKNLRKSGFMVTLTVVEKYNEEGLVWDEDFDAPAYWFRFQATIRGKSPLWTAYCDVIQDCIQSVDFQIREHLAQDVYGVESPFERCCLP